MKYIIEKSLANAGYDYVIKSEEKIRYTAYSESFTGIFRIAEYPDNGNIELVKFRRKIFRWLKPSYKIKFNKDKIELKTITLFKRQFKLDYKNDLYEIFGHSKSWKYSVFRNGKQIAWWDKQTKKYQGPDEFEIIMDGDCNELLLITFCLIMDDLIDMGIQYSENFLDIDNSINLLKGKYGEIREFNKEWIPKDTKNGL